MSDQWRARIKKAAVGNDQLLLLEFQINRTVLVSTDSFAQIMEGLNAPEFEEIKEAAQSWFLLQRDDHNIAEREKFVGLELPWKPLIFKTFSLHKLAEILDRMEEEPFFGQEGSPEAGTTSARLTIGGRSYDFPLRNSAQARRVKQEFENLADSLDSAGASITSVTGVIRVVKLLRDVIDWLGRILIVIEGVEKAREIREAQEAREREVREFRDRLERTPATRIDYDNEHQLERISRHC